MPDEKQDLPHHDPASPKEPSSDSTAGPSPPPPPQAPVDSNNDRQDLMNKACAFLASPQVRNEDIPSKRRFLVDKGLTAPEIDSLIQELPQHLPTIPPRTYPQPPPSNLPNLLVGVFRILSWVVGGSAALIALYLRYLLPRLTSSFDARRALHNHQRDLLEKLTTGTLTQLKSTQTALFAALRQEEDPQLAACTTLEQLQSLCVDKAPDIPAFTLLRCALASSSSSSVHTGQTAAQSFEAIGFHLQANPRQDKLWQTLSTIPFFTKDPSSSQSDNDPTWSYTPPALPPPTQSMASLTALRTALPTPPPAPRFHRTMQALTDLTGYLTTEAYPLLHTAGGFRRPSAAAGGSGSALLANAQHEEIRKEIRALKGLVLNRRTFTLPKAPSTPYLQTLSSESVTS